MSFCMLKLIWRHVQHIANVMCVFKLKLYYDISIYFRS